MKLPLRTIAMLCGLLVSLGLSGCGGSDDEATTLIEIDQENICEAVADVMCHNMFECCTGKEREEKLGEELTITERECVDDMILECEKQGNDPLQAAANGSFSFNLERANACVDALILPEDGSCFVNEVDPLVYQLCFDSTLGEGLAEEDGDCFWDWECAGSSYCDFEFTCVPLPTDGEDCKNLDVAPSECAEGHICTFPNRTCTAFEEPGEFCIEIMGDTDFAPCDNESAFCSGADYTTNPYTPGTCTNKFPLGASCTNSQECASAECAPGVCESNPNFTCNTADFDCPEGLCQGTTDLCTTDLDCGSSPCERRCVGNVCYEEPTPLDYCDFGLQAPCYVFGDDPDAC